MTNQEVLMSEKTRRHFDAEEKVKILKRHLLDREAVSDICDELKLSPNQFYRWQKEFFERGALAFNKPSKKEGKKAKKLEEKVSHLEDRLKHKDNIIAEITESYVKLKKNSGEL